MNTKSLSVALALAAGSVFGSMNAQAADLHTLDTLQVRPSAEQLAQREHEANSSIPTLPAVQVRPTVGQLLEQRDAQPQADRVFTLASVQVRPSADQRAEMDGRRTAANAEGSTVASVIGQVVVYLPVPTLQPSPAHLEALVAAFNPLVRF